jgi:hypothetical protein
MTKQEQTIRVSPTENYIWLQCVGYYPAKPVSELKVGDWCVWNYGESNEVVGIERVSPKFVKVIFRLKDGATHGRRMKLDRLVAVK